MIGSSDFSGRVRSVPLWRPVRNLGDLVTADGEIMLRVEFRDPWDEERTAYDTRFKAKNGKISALEGYFLEEGDDVNEKNQHYSGVAGVSSPDILVVWMSGFSPSTTFILDDKKGKYSLSLSELIDKQEIEFRDEKVSISVNYLLDKEIGLLDPATVGIKDPGDTFRFAVMADPQGGDPEDRRRFKYQDENSQCLE